MIKRIIQTWKHHDLTEAHPIFQISQTSWKKHHPKWAYEFFTDNDIDQYVALHFPNFYSSIFLKYQAQIERVDIFRNITLFVEGGLYCDLDGECLKPFDRTDGTIGATGIILGQLFNKASHNKYSNAWMCSTQPGEPFWLFTLAEAAKRQQLNRGYYSTEYLTGPILITDCIQMYREFSDKQIKKHVDQFLPDSKYNNLPKSKITILDPEIIYPIDWSTITNDERANAVSKRILHGQMPENISPRSHCVHYWTHTWNRPKYSPLDKFKLRLNYLWNSSLFRVKK